VMSEYGYVWTLKSSALIGGVVASDSSGTKLARLNGAAPVYISTSGCKNYYYSLLTTDVLLLL